jgi:hypothetical protein
VQEEGDALVKIPNQDWNFRRIDDGGLIELTFPHGGVPVVLTWPPELVYRLHMLIVLALTPAVIAGIDGQGEDVTDERVHDGG